MGLTQVHSNFLTCNTELSQYTPSAKAVEADSSPFGKTILLPFDYLTVCVYCYSNVFQKVYQRTVFYCNTWCVIDLSPMCSKAFHFLLRVF